jgi:hypothetical protein
MRERVGDVVVTFIGTLLALLVFGWVAKEYVGHEIVEFGRQIEQSAIPPSDPNGPVCDDPDVAAVSGACP